ncbi:phenylalanine--tRNA ligase subunit beta [Flammeovirga yaeyamensis]|uniref:Phenylalanine--tRNA ligase beta subunit n=1 Tax=Flammeovirga yaeyamensis TaxID=367791 RepID=A0AAX1NBP0_9BACT|nr:phenylalanine--tRNA ligase subunit beta [Flammeovirga yaeyamensis]MBB3697670.1 phenylalanyl-tRNA synthetase beta chain [Flammeovirga yaeyamensis]NMF35970.1 phenylalanine--tRNA ligase subunit beta [Flammeovirga yaeyamensis]QWG03083.1 phenylalanine--tRNA ligase subunit beta [Flammeovirga yaeyamensis]
MKISLNWLGSLVNIEDKTPQEIDELLTMSGLEVEGIEEVEEVKGGLKGLVVAEVLTCEQHPNADKLRVTTVDIGAEEPVQIVCGAPNVAAGQKVIVATIGTELYPSPTESFKIKKGKIRGEVSMGMICAEDEIGMGQSHDGIMVLDTDMANGTPAAKYFNLENDNVLEIGLTPNRVDGSSHYGAARDLKVLLDRPIQQVAKPELLDSFKVDNTSAPVQVNVQESEACPRYSGVTISGIEIKESPKWIKQRLTAIGLSPINNVVDITNYVLHELGQPLHAFDLAKVGGEINVKFATEGEEFITLDEEKRKLKGHDLMIANASENMCIAGVFGGLESGVTEGTTSIFLESAYFHPDVVRKTSQTHSIKTDSSFRFERGCDPNMTITALKYAATLIKEYAGGEISSEIVDIYPTPIENFIIDVKFKNVNRLIGQDIPQDRVIEILEGLEISILETTEETIKVSVPPFRVDVQREADIIEEILRIYGFNSVELSESLSADYLASFPKKDKQVLQRKVTEMLAGSGCHEVMTNSLTTSKYSKELSDLNENENVEILNILSADLDVMRQSMMFSGLEVINHNIRRQQKNIRIFEFGKTYHKGENGYTENEHLALFVSGTSTDESWIRKATSSDFHTVSSLVEKIFDRLNIQGISAEYVSNDTLAYGLQYSARKKVIATVGLVHPKAAKMAGVKQEVFFADINWTLLVEMYSADYKFKEIPKFPEVRRDLSIVLDKKATFASIKQVAQKTERKLLKKINVFDVYEGKHLAADLKSYSVSFILQDENKTLNDKAIDKVMNNLIKAFETQLKAVIRK